MHDKACERIATGGATISTGVNFSNRSLNSGQNLGLRMEFVAGFLPFRGTLRRGACPGSQRTPFENAESGKVTGITNMILSWSY